MKKLIAVSLFACAASCIAAAAEIETLHVTVPFAFTAGTATLPAGEYVISQQTDGRILTIGGKKGGAILVTMPEGDSRDALASNLKFARTSKGNTLLEVSMSGKPALILQHK